MQFPHARILIFAKAPIAGFAKTRLIPELGAEGAAKLSEQLLEQATSLACHAQLCAVELWCAPDSSHPVFTQLANTQPLQLEIQCQGNLGQKMADALAKTLQRCDYAILMGIDAPAVDTGMLQTALQALEDGQDVVLGPVEDGGYWLIGMKQARPELFAGIIWGGSEVANATRDRIRADGLKWIELPITWDLDEPQDLRAIVKSGDMK